MRNSFNKNRYKKWTLIVAADVIILMLIIGFVVVLHPFSHTKIDIKAVYIEKPQTIPAFSMIDHHGNAFSNAQLKGHWTFIFFGFTHCPMICPVSFQALNKMYLLLEKRLSSDLLPQVVFVTIDPQRDTLQRLNQYIHLYNPKFIGLRANPVLTKNIERLFSIKVSGKNENITHNTDILLINPKVQIQAYFLYPHFPQSMADDYYKIIMSSSPSK